MSRNPLLLALPPAIAIVLALTPADRLLTVAIAAGAIAAATLGVALALNSRPRAEVFGRGAAFDIEQSEPVAALGQIMAIRFDDRRLLVCATRGAVRVLAEAAIPKGNDDEIPRPLPAERPGRPARAAHEPSRLASFHSLGSGVGAEIDA